MIRGRIPTARVGQRHRDQGLAGGDEVGPSGEHRDDRRRASPVMNDGGNRGTRPQQGPNPDGQPCSQRASHPGGRLAARLGWGSGLGGPRPAAMGSPARLAKPGPSRKNHHPSSAGRSTVNFASYIGEIHRPWLRGGQRGDFCQSRGERDGQSRGELRGRIRGERDSQSRCGRDGEWRPSVRPASLLRPIVTGLWPLARKPSSSAPDHRLDRVDPRVALVLAGDQPPGCLRGGRCARASRPPPSS